MSDDYATVRAQRRREAGKHDDFRAERSLPLHVQQDIDSATYRAAAKDAAAARNWTPHDLFRR